MNRAQPRQRLAAESPRRHSISCGSRLLDGLSATGTRRRSSSASRTDKDAPTFPGSPWSNARGPLEAARQWQASLRLELDDDWCRIASPVATPRAVSSTAVPGTRRIALASDALLAAHHNWLSNARPSPLLGTSSEDREALCQELLAKEDERHAFARNAHSARRQCSSWSAVASQHAPKLLEQTSAPSQTQEAALGRSRMSASDFIESTCFPKRHALGQHNAPALDAAVAADMPMPVAPEKPPSGTRRRPSWTSPSASQQAHESSHAQEYDLRQAERAVVVPSTALQSYDELDLRRKGLVAMSIARHRLAIMLSAWTAWESCFNDKARLARTPRNHNEENLCHVADGSLCQQKKYLEPVGAKELIAFPVGDADPLGNASAAAAGEPQLDFGCQRFLNRAACRSAPAHPRLGSPPRLVGSAYACRSNDARENHALDDASEGYGKDWPAAEPKRKAGAELCGRKYDSTAILQRHLQRSSGEHENRSPAPSCPSELASAGCTMVRGYSLPPPDSPRTPQDTKSQPLDPAVAVRDEPVRADTSLRRSDIPFHWLDGQHGDPSPSAAPSRPAGNPSIPGTSVVAPSLADSGRQSQHLLRRALSLGPQDSIEFAASAEQAIVTRRALPRDPPEQSMRSARRLSCGLGESAPQRHVSSVVSDRSVSACARQAMGLCPASPAMEEPPRSWRNGATQTRLQPSDCTVLTQGTPQCCRPSTPRRTPCQQPAGMIARLSRVRAWR